jgi:hypothetical protein
MSGLMGDQSGYMQALNQHAAYETEAAAKKYAAMRQEHAKCQSPGYAADCAPASLPEAELALTRLVNIGDHLNGVFMRVEALNMRTLGPEPCEQSTGNEIKRNPSSLAERLHDAVDRVGRVAAALEHEIARAERFA